ncbi:tripartite tricarboxylate transporter substrate binding protein BugE [Belnapia sp. T18]|uniref:Tripartite tricarboxylate transporter substrate binding protein BugE n=1 Tax=Belnapia arida TaxID=2804533 RepID=A0ABS1UBF4_9PROT|nr:tripartite tricarboxylate transporter substrate binding protein BugE [Belnapia arida]MBL6082025.1 tripartite tricarboxylate transporter substrate binding protein BugE [Belnapia arida]
MQNGNTTGGLDRRTLLLAGLAVAPLLGTSRACAQAYPDRAVKLLVPFAPGGTTDIIARVVTSQIAPHFNGQSMVVENKGGGGGVTGAIETARARPDGYSLGIATVSTVATVPAIQPSTPYDPLTAFTPITNIAATPNVVAVHPSFPAKTFQAWADEVKRNPGKYAYATSGTGSILHLQMELYKSLSGADLTHIPYRGSGPALNDAVAGQVPVIIDNLPSALPFIQTGRLVPIVVASPQRVAALPDVPTFKEVGLEQVNRVAFYGFVGPKGLPRPIVERVREAVLKTLAEPMVRGRVEETGSFIVANTPEEFAQQIKTEYEVYKKVVQERKLQPD